MAFSRTGIFSRAAKFIRFRDWWESKVGVTLGTAYAIVLFLKVPLGTFWHLLFLALLALFMAASYVSVLNDLTDWQDDLAAGKLNPGADRRTNLRAVVLTLLVLCGCGVLYTFRHYPFTCFLYLANWVVFTLYSVPPIRLKARAEWGVLMDAFGSHVLPTLWAATLIAEGVGSLLPASFLVPLTIWACALGLRLILFHQIRDFAIDTKTGTRTFVVRWGIRAAQHLIARCLFPIEVAALIFILVRVGSPWALPILLVYFLASGFRYFCAGTKLVLAVPTRNFSQILEEYYPLFYPFTFLLALAPRDLFALIIVGLHFLLFPKSIDRLLAPCRKRLFGPATLPRLFD